MSAIPGSVLRAIAHLSAREVRLIAARHRGEMEMLEGADKVQALLAAVRILDELRAPYALIGGVAVGLHTRVPRATLDTDLAVRTTHRGPTLTAAFVAAGFVLRGEHPHSVNFRHASGEPVQLAFDVVFDPMLDRVAVFDVDGVEVRVVAKDDLIAMKRRAAADPTRRRSKVLRDQADVELLLGDIPDPDEGW
ncbi:MAG: nucleotidyl transferase AbiEii/AbiGii toxin family protein [Planctomycetota bacterium]